MVTCEIINRDLGNHVKAIKYYQQSIEQANKVSDWYTLSWVYSMTCISFILQNVIQLMPLRVLSFLNNSMIQLS